MAMNYEPAPVGVHVGVAPVQDQGRRLDQRQDAPRVQLERGVQERLDCRGLAMARWNFANQRRKRSSPARLGTNVTAIASVPRISSS
jgi:hypothetical protein